ncbi:tripartite motif-containing protein 2-like [Hyalella azteca]|uniref:Tripartite motif-containing protein 2-like n=1 Tax=Hyalella azteca TaxID=294128 RepID=A0A8B7N9W1_HYAAZ|nr:tripartite motif-containing protein 2-like [Hyalella azteca]
MAASLLECEICAEEFDENNHKPLFLPCGHTYCYTCISSLLKNPQSRLCPKCRKEISVHGIQVNYVLMNTKGESSKRPLELETLCPHHGSDVDYICVECHELLCFTCLEGIHAEHQISLIDDLLLKNGDVDSRTKIQTALQGKLEQLNNMASVFSKTLKFIDELIKLKTNIGGWNNFVDAQINSTKEDLRAWVNLPTCVDDNKRIKCKEIIGRVKLEPTENEFMLQEIHKKFNAASKEWDSLKGNGEASMLVSGCEKFINP